MTNKRGLFAAVAVSVLGLLLTGCIGGGSGPGARAPSGVEGAWIDAGGTSLSRLSAGQFSTVATNTGETLSQGTYTMTSANSVHITGTSRVSQSQVSFNCSMMSINQLACTSATGQQFMLTRRA